MRGRDRTIPDGTLDRAVAAVEPSWRVRDADPADGGSLPVYHLSVVTPDGPRACVLKATPDDGRHGVDTEARLLRLLDAHTSLPVPEVLGAVETHDDLPAPFFVMESAEGTKLPRRHAGRLPGDAVERVARQTGRHLAELHGLARLDGFGRVDAAASRPLRGGRPPADLDRLTVTGFQGAAASCDWPTVVRAWATDALDRHADSRFGDLTPDLRAALHDRVDALSGPFRPVVGRIDHGLHNLLLDPDTGDVTALLDWAFTLAVPPAYDLACVEANLVREPWSMLPGTPDHDRLVRDAMLAEYRQGADDAVERLRENRACYDLLALVRAMTHLDVAMDGATDEQRATAAEAYRNEVDAYL